MVDAAVAQDPMAELFADPEFVDGYLNALREEYAARGGFIDDFEPGFADGDEMVPPPDASVDLGVLDGPTPPGFSLEDLFRYERVAAARQDQWIHDLLTDAANDPTGWTDTEGNYPAMVGPRGMSVAEYLAECRDLAIQAAVLDIAVRTQLSEGQVHARARRAQVLSARCPRLWAAYQAGDVPQQNAAYATTMVDELPDDPAAWAAFDENVTGPATRLTSGKFRDRARKVRERVHPESVNERHARAAKSRDVWATPELDGLILLVMRLPAASGQAINEFLDLQSRHLAAQPGEIRTLAQLRADIAADLMLSGALAALPDDATDALRDAADAGTDTDTEMDAEDAADADDADDRAETPAGTAGPNGTLPLLKGITPTVRLTIPALALLGQSDEPATLDGYGPIDIETAKRLAGAAKSWIRVLTHPITGTILNVDRKTYRVPADLRRWLDTQYPTCVAPGCTRPAPRCDIDHRKRWADGGTTDADNLCPLCEHHHTLKDCTLWQLIRDAATRELYWVSPTGHVSPVESPFADHIATPAPAAQHDEPPPDACDDPPPF